MNTRKIMLISLLGILFILPFAFTAFGQSQNIIEIVEGKSKEIKIDFVIEKVAIGDPKICRTVKVSDKALLINAQTVGKSNIIIWGSENKRRELLVNVIGSDITADAEELKQLLKDIEGVSVRIVGRRILVEGGVFTKSSLEKIAKILGDMPNVLNLVELSPVMKKIVSKEILRAIREEGLVGVRVKVGKTKFVLTGKVRSEGASKRAESIALAYSPDIVNAIEIDTKTTVERPVLIEMSLNIMEIDKNTLKDMGFHWNPGGSLGAEGSYSGGTGKSSTFLGALSGTISNLFPKMRKIKEDGRGRSLKQQSLITKSGEKAKFFVGSEIPVPVAQGDGTMSVDYKKVGLTLNFTPTIDVYKNINSAIEVESSSVTGEGSGGAPVIATSQLQTMVSVKSGSSIALAGLVGQSDRKVISGSPPGGGSSLFQLNKAERLSMEANEVVIFITPRILTGSKTDVKEIGKKAEESFKKQELENVREQIKKK